MSERPTVTHGTQGDGVRLVSMTEAELRARDEAIIRATLAQTHFHPQPHNLGWIGDKWVAIVDTIIAAADREDTT